MGVSACGLKSEKREEVKMIFRGDLNIKVREFLIYSVVGMWGVNL